MQRTPVLDVAVAAAFTAWMLAEVPLEHLRPAWVDAPTFALVGVALAWRRSRPVPVGIAFVAVMIVQAAAGTSLHTAVAPVMALLLVSWSIGAGETPRRAVLGLVVLACGVWVAMGIDILRGTDHYAGTDVPWIGGLVLAPGIAGLAFGSRALREELRHRTAVAEERARIARELHDVVAHSVAVMTVQAGAAQAMLERDPARAADPVRAVQETGRQALAEMKRLVGMLREGDEEIGLDPQPGLTQVGELLGPVRETGVDAELEVSGERRPLPPGVELSAYRIVQEALTNVLKHAGCGRVRVALRYAASELEVEVADDGRGPVASSRGHGLAGMRERAAVFGGSLETVAPEAGGFVVRARLPLEPPS
ncbi:MAG TPA: sensor histidine kinase [Gaiellaceae bacterium]